MAKKDKFYVLDQTAGLIRSNKFQDQADAVCIGTYRAETLGKPVKVIEYTPAEEGGGYDTKTVLVCMPDGSAKKPEDAKEMKEGHEDVEFRNQSESHMLLSNYEDYPITTYYLKQDLSETLAGEMEKEYGLELGLYDPRTLHAYTEDSGKLKRLEEKLAEAGLEIDRVRDSKVKRERLQAAADLVEAAKKAKASGSKLPSLTLKISAHRGKALSLDLRCEEDPKKQGKINIYDGSSVVGEATNPVSASARMVDYAEDELKSWFKKTF